MIAHLELRQDRLRVRTADGEVGDFAKEACPAFYEEMVRTRWMGWASVSVTLENHLIVHCLVQGPKEEAAAAREEADEEPFSWLDWAGLAAMVALVAVLLGVFFSSVGCATAPKLQEPPCVICGWWRESESSPWQFQCPPECNEPYDFCSGLEPVGKQKQLCNR